jgi:hypothetical protein
MAMERIDFAKLSEIVDVKGTETCPILVYLLRQLTGLAFHRVLYRLVVAGNGIWDI